MSNWVKCTQHSTRSPIYINFDAAVSVSKGDSPTTEGETFTRVVFTYGSKEDRYENVRESLEEVAGFLLNPTFPP